MFSTLSEGSDLNEKLDVFVALAPIVNLKNSLEGYLQDIAGQWYTFQSSAIHLKVYEILDPKFDSHLRTFCSIFGPICNELSKLFEMKSPYSDLESWELQ